MAPMQRCPPTATPTAAPPSLSLSFTGSVSSLSPLSPQLRRLSRLPSPPWWRAQEESALGPQVDTGGAPPHRDLARLSGA
ncbi:hypothetical protein E2562_038768 [Oryza meyeriana var. granulata]|uniref:Uncharacterized protein n=1 Tax=Oryza meyeriana var. granulata TaxID=110450 RepID=A0A6G1FH43_9ORYZ|nr:hypothetical protein E2562_038768 [Oryza meyeriana var. granulata]